MKERRYGLMIVEGKGSVSIDELVKQAGEKCGDCPVLRRVEETLAAMETSRTERERGLRLEVAEKVVDGLIGMRNIPVKRGLR